MGNKYLLSSDTFSSTSSSYDDLLALQLDSLSKYKNLLASSDINEKDYLILPKSNPNDNNRYDIIDPINTKKEFNIDDLLFNEDPDKRELAKNYLESKVTKSDIINSATANEAIFRYTPKSNLWGDIDNYEKAINSKVGLDLYDIGETSNILDSWEAKMDKYKSDNHSFLRRFIDKTGKFAANIGIGFVKNVVGGFAQLAYTPTAILDSIVNNKSVWEAYSENGFVNYLNDAAEKLQNTNLLKSYKPGGYDKMSFFNQLAQGYTYETTVSDMAAFVLGAYGGGGIIGKGVSTTLGRVNNILNKTIAIENTALTTSNVLNKTANTFSKLFNNSWGNFSSFAYNTANEAYIEGKGIYDEILSEKKLELDKKLQNRELTQEDYNKELDLAKDKAGKSASFAFNGNMIALLASNLWENRLMFGGTKKLKGITSAEINKSGEVAQKMYSSLFAKNVLNPTSRINFYGSNILKGFAIEGLYEENIQFAIANAAKDKGNVLSNWISQMGDAFKGFKQDASSEDREALANIFWGGVMGGGMSIMSSKFQKKQSLEEGEELSFRNRNFYGERRNQKEFDKEKIEKINSILKDTKDSIFDLKNAINEDGSINKEVVGRLQKKLGNIIQDTVTAETLKDPNLQNKILKNAFFEYLEEVHKVGLSENLFNRLNGEGLNKETLDILGLNIESKEKNTYVNKLVEKGKNLLKKYDEIDEIVFPTDKFINEQQSFQLNEQRKYILKNIYKSYLTLTDDINNNILDFETFKNNNLNYKELSPENKIYFDNYLKYKKDLFKYNIASQKLRLHEYSKKTNNKNFLLSDYEIKVLKSTLKPILEKYIESEKDILTGTIIKSTDDIIKTIEFKDSFILDLMNSDISNSEFQKEHYNLLFDIMGKSNVKEFKSILKNFKKEKENHQAEDIFVINNNIYTSEDIESLYNKEEITEDDILIAIEDFKEINGIKEKVPYDSEKETFSNYLSRFKKSLRILKEGNIEGLEIIIDKDTDKLLYKVNNTVFNAKEEALIELNKVKQKEKEREDIISRTKVDSNTPINFTFEELSKMEIADIASKLNITFEEAKKVKDNAINNVKVNIAITEKIINKNENIAVNDFLEDTEAVTEAMNNAISTSIVDLESDFINNLGCK